MHQQQQSYFKTLCRQLVKASLVDTTITAFFNKMQLCVQCDKFNQRTGSRLTQHLFCCCRTSERDAIPVPCVAHSNHVGCLFMFLLGSVVRCEKPRNTILQPSQCFLLETLEIKTPSWVADAVNNLSKTVSQWLAAACPAAEPNQKTPVWHFTCCSLPLRNQNAAVTALFQIPCLDTQHSGRRPAMNAWKKQKKSDDHDHQSKSNHVLSCQLQKASLPNTTAVGSSTQRIPDIAARLGGHSHHLTAGCS